ncbi:hypothetical protein LCI18_011830 [Fusarium solani-melongenae]|uniref:Uncharacterized protein n=1 Tax=Fusarium solani subsp. cucurbitae TaxID=2747967 RepID=A0ACD3ZI38_FUSSC|nr:hypothetical protein LCI18_011830 [Fusarium solani-melongenae]
MVKVAIAGASGEIGQSIIDGLLKSSTPFTVTALIRPSSIHNPEINAIKARGVSIIPLGLESTHEQLVEALSGHEVVISALDPFCVSHQITLANAASDAKVGRFVPSAFGPVCPPQGVVALREMKEEVINYVKNIYLPYTIIDVGWWYQSSTPNLPSGKIDYVLTFGMSRIVEDGSHATCIIDLRDIGKYVAMAIVDDRTLNKSVLIYNEVRTQEEIYQLLEAESGESLVRSRITRDEITASIEATRKPYDDGDRSFALIPLVMAQYHLSIWLRGDNLPERAEYLGYLTSKQLYPDFKYIPFEEYVDELLKGRGKAVCANGGFGS